MKFRTVLYVLLSSLLLACGGGGGGAASVTVTGRVLNIDTGAPFTTAATVQTAGANANTSVVDGSFSLKASSGLTGLSVVSPVALGFPVFDFSFPAQTQAVNDVGDLWVGPQRVTVRGIARSASTNLGIPGAKVQFGGQFANTASDGTFQIQNVGYSAANTASFLGLVGRIDATNFFSNEFTPAGNLAISGVVDIGEVLMTPLDSSTPPGLPYNLWGIIAPSGVANGTIVTLKDSGGTVVRRFTVGTDARFQFWVIAGSYRIEFQNGTLTAPAQNVTLSNSSDVIRTDATLN